MSGVAATGAGARAGTAFDALSELRTARKANQLQGLPWGETLYRVYIIVVGVGGMVWWLATILGDRQVSASAVADVRKTGPAAIGLILSVVLGGALRSGARGAALTIEPADVAHVLQAPIPRSRSLRRPAIHSLRKGLFSALITGGATGALAAPFLPGGPARWIFFTAGAAGLVGIGSAGLALVAGGRRLHPRLAVAASVVLLGWSIADIARSTTTSPLSFLGSVFLAPLPGRVKWSSGAAVVLLICVLILLVSAIAGLGGVAIEAAERRARLVSQLRFAVSTQDLRAVVLLRRQLASERSRRRPWFHVKGQSGPGGAIVTRGIRSLARWPLARVARIVVLAAVAGLTLRLAYEGTLPLVILSALCFFVMGLDMVEPLAQDADRPDLLKSLPRHRGRMANRQLIVPAVASTLLGAIAGGVAIAAGGWTHNTVGPAGQTAFAVFVAALCGCVVGTLGAAVNVAQGPPSLATMLSTPEFAFLRTALPIILTIIGTTAPLLSARIAAMDKKSPVVYPGIVRGLLAVGIISYGVVLWITDGGIREPK